MCGILLALQPSTRVNEQFELTWDKLKVANASRGPDAQECHTTCIGNSESDDGLSLRCFASELRLRGNSPVVQPHTEEGDVFCWNGEVFEGLDIDPSENDGAKLFGKIRRFSVDDDFENGLLEIMRSIEGPFAFTYYRSTSKRLYFGRDPLGRRSLLVQRPVPENPTLLLASVSYGYDTALNLEELPTDFIYYFDLAAMTPNSVGCSVPPIGQLLRAPAKRPSPPSCFATPGSVNRVLPPDQPPLARDLSVTPPELTQSVDELIAHLSRSVQLRVRDIPYHGEKGRARVAVLFSGGIDSTVIAYLAHQHLPEDEPIDLLNVAFENPRKNQTQVDEKAVRNGSKKKKHTRPVNVDKGPVSYLVPDRVTGLEELEEFNRLCPNRRWNFVEIDVPFEESSNARPIVESLMSPSRTVMDMSLGLALYFASKGEGYVRTTSTGDRHPYKSTARVLLNGLGSDELLGGYGRHRTAFTAGGWPAVIDELQLEIDRIPTRNLGRDDRVISSHGKEVRHPFLSLSVVNFLASLPVHTKMDARLPLGVGDKMLLRLAARKLGLDVASGRKKRAMQFGSHSARMEAGESEKRGDILLKSAE